MGSDSKSRTFAILCIAELTWTTRPPIAVPGLRRLDDSIAAARKFGLSSLESNTCAKKLAPKLRSKPSAVSSRRAEKAPALHTSAWIGAGSFAINRAACSLYLGRQRSLMSWSDALFVASAISSAFWRFACSAAINWTCRAHSTTDAMRERSSSTKYARPAKIASMRPSPNSSVSFTLSIA